MTKYMIISSRKLMLILYLLVILFCFYSIMTGIHDRRSTGLLQVTASSKTAIITVSQADRQPAIVGTGSAHIRLAPGAYQIVASDGQSQTTKSTTIYIGQLSSVKIDLQPVNQVKQSKDAEANSLIALLPYTGPAFEYKISYRYSFSSKSAQPTITITAPSPQTQQDAVAWIRSVGYNPSNLSIEYVTSDIE